MDTIIGTSSRNYVINNKKEKVLIADVAKHTVIGIYFSAHWCGPCRRFTPELAKIYQQCKAEGKSFEVVFVSSDRDEASFAEYFGTMPWLAIPFEDRDTKAQLSGKYHISGIPTLVLLDSNGGVIDLEGDGKVEQLGAKGFPWK